MIIIIDTSCNLFSPLYCWKFVCLWSLICTLHFCCRYGIVHVMKVTNRVSVIFSLLIMWMVLLFHLFWKYFEPKPFYSHLIFIKHVDWSISCFEIQVIFLEFTFPVNLVTKCIKFWLFSFLISLLLRSKLNV